MEQAYSFPNVWMTLFGEDIEMIKYWSKKRRIPIGTLKPYKNYPLVNKKRVIPMCDIVTIPFDDVLTSFNKRNLLNILFLGASGDGKCNHGSVKILMNNGEHKKIKDIPNKGLLVSVNQSTLKNEIKKYIKIKNKYKQPCYKIITQFGSEIICSENHPFLTNKSEWTKIKDLKEKQFIGLTRNIPFFGNNNMSDDEIKVLAYMISDGSSHNSEYTKNDEKLINELGEAVKSFRCKLISKKSAKYSYSINMNYKRGRYEKSPIRILLEKHGLFGKKSVEKVIPKQIISLTKPKLKLFLNRLFSGDGTIWRSKNRKKFRYTVQYCSGNKEMCMQIKHLLLRFGILSNTYAKHNKTYDKDYYYVEIQNSYFIRKFIERIGFFGEKHEREIKWSKDLYNINSNTNFDLVPIKKGKYWVSRTGSKKYDKTLSESDIFWDRVKSVGYVGMEETYDLQVEDNENYLGNDFIAHNSLILKIIWFVLWEAGYYVIYIDPKSNESGRSKRAWDSPKIPPHLYPEPISLTHFYPAWAKERIEHIKHNFHLYSVELEEFDTRSYWQGLGMTSSAGLKCDQICKKLKMEGKKISIDLIRKKFKELLDNDQIFLQSYKGAMGVLDDIENYDLVNNKRYEIFDPLKYWKKGESVCVSYAGKFNEHFMTFDIGMRVRQVVRYFSTGRLRRPVMFIFDDASYYAKNLQLVKFNFASQEIIDIGNNYRAMGLNNTLAVQSLGIIDENVAFTYKFKIISPLFANPESLKKINIPKKAIAYLEASDVLYKDTRRHLLQWLLIDKDNNVIPFFPFTPNTNHFVEVYNTIFDDKGDY